MVFHIQLHVIPRGALEGWTSLLDEVARERSLLDGEARVIQDAIASTD